MQYNKSGRIFKIYFICAALKKKLNTSSWNFQLALNLESSQIFLALGSFMLALV